MEKITQSRPESEYSHKVASYLVGASVLATASVSQATAIFHVDYDPDINAQDLNTSTVDPEQRQVIDITLNISDLIAESPDFGATSILTGSPTLEANHLYMAPKDFGNGDMGDIKGGGFAAGTNVSFKQAIAPGDLIDENLDWRSPGSLDCCINFLPPGKDLLTAVRLQGEMDGMEVFYYGWLRYSTDLESVTLKELAFETTKDTAITAPIPLPGTLALLATGLAGMTAMRRRRKSNA